VEGNRRLAAVIFAVGGSLFVAALAGAAADSRFFFSKRVNPRRLGYQPAYQEWSIPALELR